MARKSTGARKTDMFNHGRNGKGDVDRTTDREAYRRNLAEIVLPGQVEGLTNVGAGRFRKTYR